MRKTPKQQLDEALKTLKEAQSAYDLKLAEYTEKEEKAQTKRSIERGKVVGNALPELAILTKSQFAAYMGKVMLTDYARLALMEICEETKTPAVPMGGKDTGQSNGTAAPTPAQAAGHTNTPPTPKPAETPRNGNGIGNGNGGGNTGQ